MKKIILKFSFLPIIFVILFLLPLIVKPVNAMDFRSGQSISVSKSEIINGTLLAGGSSVMISGVINGDIFCAGQSVVINATVNGDVICAARDLTINGLVSGNIRAAGQTVTIGNSIEKNVTVFGQTINVKEVNISGDLIMAGQTMFVSGNVRRDLAIAGERMDVSGTIDGNITAEIQNLQFDNNAVVNGLVDYRSKAEAVIMPGAKIAGKITKLAPQLDKASRPPIINQERSVSSPIRNLFNILIWLGLGLLFIVLAPTKYREITAVLENKPWVSLGIGLLVLAVTPAIVIFLIFTLIGIPVAAIWIFLLIILLLIGRLFCARLIGERLLNKFWVAQKDSEIMAVSFGVIVLWILFHIPFFGWIISFLSMVLGFGALILSNQRIVNKKKVK
jgi:cytoskeletal protein CcmA (bactofilin family)